MTTRHLTSPRHRPVDPHGPGRSARATDLAGRVAGAALAVAVTWIHVVDQGGVTALKDPAYVGVGYWALEVAGLLVAGLLLLGGARARLAGWTLALGVALGPAVGFALSRGPGLPDYADDRGNWTEPLALQALAVEGALLVVAVVALGRRRAHARA